MTMIYLDHNATTPVAPEAAKAARVYLETEFGNPSSDYDLGQRARAAVEKARARVAELIGARPEEIVFTSGGTEANNAAIKGIIYKIDRPVHLIATNIEHPAVMNPAMFLMYQGAEVTFLHADLSGRVDPEEVRRSIRPETRLITVMLANNETGVIQPVEEIARIAREHGIPLHTDAAQAVGKIPVNVADLSVDLLSIAGHKLYAPKGVGALYIRTGVELEPFMHGAGQESGRRAGTENTALIAALGEACRLAGERLAHDGPRLRRLRDRLWEKIKAGIPEAYLVGDPERRLPNTLNVCLPGRDGSDILAKAPEIRASTGAACHAGQIKISPVLSAMGLDKEIARGAVRLSLGRGNTEAEIDLAAEALIRAVRG